jgi:hypothetical protein
MKEGKILLFLKKKKQKDFYSMVARLLSLGACGREARPKVFFASFFFRKKKTLPPTEKPPPHSQR